LYASLIGVNAYHQPGVEAGKKAAETVIGWQRRILAFVAERKGQMLTSDQIASGIGAHGEFETVFKVCEHLSANGRLIRHATGKNPFEAGYQGS
jgi:glucose-6-phosphate isomerase